MKLSKAQKRLLDRAKLEPIYHSQDKEGDIYFFGSGENAHVTAVRNLIEKGALIPGDDALFGDAPQSWRAA